MSLETKKTQVIILRKTPYKETSLIVSSLSPHYGRLDFVLKGELKITKKKSPTFDLFREVEIEFKDKDSDLQTPSSINLLTSFDNISFYPKKFAIACKIAIFIMKNTFSNISCKNCYLSLKNILTKLSSNSEILYPETLIKLEYLNENGLLPSSFSNSDNIESSKQNKFIELLLKYSKGEIETLPSLNEEYWKKFNGWIVNLSRYHHLKLEN
jgi:DNA repair protein RecO